MLEITEQNLGNQLLPISHGYQEISLKSVVTRRTLAELAETFPWKGQYVEQRDQAVTSAQSHKIRETTQEQVIEASSCNWELIGSSGLKPQR